MANGDECPVAYAVLSEALYQAAILPPVAGNSASGSMLRGLKRGDCNLEGEMLPSSNRLELVVCLRFRSLIANDERCPCRWRNPKIANLKLELPVQRAGQRCKYNLKLRKKSIPMKYRIHQLHQTIIDHCSVPT